MTQSKSITEDKNIHLVIIRQVTTLATSGFGLVSALAWNSVIKETVDIYIKPFVSDGSGVLSLLIYAVLVTVLAVIVTLQLAKLEQKMSRLDQIVKSKIKHLPKSIK